MILELTRLSEVKLSWEMIPLTIVQMTIGITIILIQFSHISPMNPSDTIVFPPKRPAIEPNIMAAKICVVNDTFLPEPIILHPSLKRAYNTASMSLMI